MKTEKEKMLAGELYDPIDPVLCEERKRARDLCQELNASREEQTEERARIAGELFAQESDVWIQPGFPHLATGPRPASERPGSFVFRSLPPRWPRGVWPCRRTQ